MTQLYSRIFTQILDSSLADDWQARHVFEDILKLASDGVLDMTRDALCRRTNVPRDVIDRAISVLEAPDSASRDPTEDGRRLVRLDEHRDWGWRIVNWEKYEAIKCKEDERAKVAERVRRHREKKERSKERTPDSDSDSDSDSEETLLFVTKRYKALQLPASLDVPEFKVVWDEWVSYRLSLPKKPRNPALMFQKQISMLQRYTPLQAAEVLNKSMRNGWQGLFEPSETILQNSARPGPTTAQEALIRDIRSVPVPGIRP